MKRILKRAGLAACVAVMLLMFSSCLDYQESMYTIPDPVTPNEAVQQEIDKLVSDDYIYSAPLSGENRQNFMSVDLDGDSDDEIIYFLKNTDESEEKPLKVFVWWKPKGYREDSFTSYPISGEGMAIESCTVKDLDGDGMKEIIIGWQESGSKNLLEVYSVKKTPVPSLRDGTSYRFEISMVENGSTYYSNYTFCNFYSDTYVANIFVVRRKGLGNNILSANEREAVLYSLKNGVDRESGEPVKILESTNSAALSSRVKSVQKISIAKLSKGIVAAYVDSESYYNGDYITDVFALKMHNLVNVITAQEESYRANDKEPTSTFRPARVFCTDIDGDGVIDVPIFQLLGDKNRYFKEYLIMWYEYSINSRELKLITYYNPEDIWYYVISDDKKVIDKLENLYVRRDYTYGVQSVVFSYKTESDDRDILKISAYRGDEEVKKEYEKLIESGKGVRLGSTANGEQVDAVYVGEILNNDFPELTDNLEAKFKLNYPEWISEAVKSVD